MRDCNAGVDGNPALMSRKIVLPGGSGFLGRELARAFSLGGWDVVVLSRTAAPPIYGIRTMAWDGRTVGDWARELEGADAVINLAGRSLVCLHTTANRREILESRLSSVAAVDAAVAQCRKAPKVLIQVSAVGIYGDTGDRACDESAPPAADFIADVVAQWEDAFFGAQGPGEPRKVALRCGVVLGRDGGALPPLVRLARNFLGGSCGSGRQYMSWLHLEDFCAICAWAVAQTGSVGVYNATAPSQATNARFMRELRGALGRPWCPPAPAWVVALAARHLMRVEPSLILSGCRAVPARLLAEGYSFRHPELVPALRDLVATPSLGRLNRTRSAPQRQ